jgi:drug/metabolite transporter (DMT)-like permease
MNTVNSENTQKTSSPFPEWVYHAEILVSALFFAFSTLLAKFAEKQAITASTITFFRFAIGLAILLVYIGVTRTKLEPRNPVALILRGIFNLLAVFLFYYAIKYTTITNANLLNLTYPVFVAVLAPIVLHEHLQRRDWLILALAGVGIWLIINPDFQRLNADFKGNLVGLAGGFAGGLAILALCFARRDNNTATVLLFMLGVGTVLSSPGAIGEHFSKYTLSTWLLLFGCGATGVVGQFAITHGFRHLSAFAGSITGMTRVVMAAILGFVFLAEVPTWSVIFGSAILFAAIWLLASNQSQKECNS